MRRFIILTIFTLIFAFPHTISAKYVTVDKAGGVIVNVLADTDDVTLTPQRESLEITKLSDTTNTGSKSVQLQKNNDAVQILVANGQGKQTLSVTKEDTTLIEIEERPETQRVKIGVKDGLFTLKQKEFTATTSYPLTIDASSARLSAVTQTGEKFIAILPFEAIESAMRSKILTQVDGNQFSIIEEEQELQYKIIGKKVFDILSLYQFEIPVETYVSASNGEIVKIDSSTWYRFLNILVG